MTAAEIVRGWRTLFSRHMLICVFLGFSSGLPLFVVLNLFQAWLRDRGVSLTNVGLATLVQLPYIFKFLWAPLLDRYSITGLGRRRGWMLVMHVAVLLAIAGLGQLDPARGIGPVLAGALVLVFCSATLDIAIDAFRRELLPDREQGLGTAVHVNAYKVAGLVPGSLALVLADHLPWSAVFAITSVFMLPGIGMTLVVAEPALTGLPPRTLKDAVTRPFMEFFARHGPGFALLVLGFIFLYKLGDSMSTSLATAFYLDLGFTKTQIGLIAKNFGLWSSVAGGLVGGLWLISLGINRALWIFGALQVLPILGFAFLAQSGPNPVLLAVVISAEAFISVGLGTAAFTAFIARTTDPRYTALQFALFTSLAAAPRSLVNASSGHIVEVTGWFTYFLICAALALPGLALLPFVAPWRADPGPPSAAGRGG